MMDPSSHKDQSVMGYIKRHYAVFIVAVGASLLVLLGLVVMGTRPGAVTYEALAVRAQDRVEAANPDDYIAVGPSVIVQSKATAPDGVSWERVSKDNAIVSPEDRMYSALGAEDPRIWQDETTGAYYMYYTAVQTCDITTGFTCNGDNPCRGTDLNSSVVAQLALATSLDGETWEQRGHVFTGDDKPCWSKSGAFIPYPDRVGGWLLWGDSSISIATTEDMVNYTNHKTVISPRPGMFDDHLCESGPPPMRLSDGNWFFLYNSARDVEQSVKPGYALQYNLGWAVLKSDDPSVVLARSDSPILTPGYNDSGVWDDDLEWESCNVDHDVLRVKPLTPNVVFVEGWWRNENSRSWFDEFTLVYQGATGTLAMPGTDTTLLVLSLLCALSVCGASGVYVTGTNNRGQLGVGDMRERDALTLIDQEVQRGLVMHILEYF
ncbi:mannoside phosphorylase [Kipferlia bialata]|uniref:Mannoside phosphorylase n=1 Tax=Kipferlia bialata TaxID=797122 RepID=A0A9K3CT23_9EUKA|nr:mannoside phosphorylase [Kipferlia bialata]|eukprot:g2595.t1